MYQIYWKSIQIIFLISYIFLSRGNDTYVIRRIIITWTWDFHGFIMQYRLNYYQNLAFICSVRFCRACTIQNASEKDKKKENKQDELHP